MAIVGRFDRVNTNSGRRHPTTVRCSWQIINDSRGTLLQLDTHGSSERAIPDKVSQTLQLDRDGAAALVRILRTAFPDLG